jgi:hypothetical protein
MLTGLLFLLAYTDNILAGGRKGSAAILPRYAPRLLNSLGPSDFLTHKIRRTFFFGSICFAEFS